LHDRYRHSVALGLAQATLAGPLHDQGLAARLRVATGERGSWIDGLAQDIANACAVSWPRQRAETLAERVLHEPAFVAAFERADVLRLRRYLLRAGKQLPPPLGLDGVDLPTLATVGDLASWLGIDSDALD